jgi:hypothetical protein
MKAIIDLPVNGDLCGKCTLAFWGADRNGWAWVCSLFNHALTTRYWKQDTGWKKMRMMKPETLSRCRGCCEATKALAELEEKHLKAEIIRYAAGEDD